MLRQIPITRISKSPRIALDFGSRTCATLLFRSAVARTESTKSSGFLAVSLT